MRTLTGTDIEVHPLCLGGNVFGWSADRDESFAILDAYAEAGGNFIDTADVYSAWTGSDGGESETIIGEWMESRGVRAEMVIATKVGKAPGLANLAPETIRTAVERSCTRLRTDVIDLYYAHQDRDDPLTGTLEAFDSLVRAGRVRFLAASNYPVSRLREAESICAERGLAGYRVIQPQYHLLHRDEVEGELSDYCLEHGLGIVPYYGLARGYLTGKYRVGGPRVQSVRAEGAAQYVDDRGERVLDALATIAARRRVAPAAVALAWLAQQPGVVAPIASARTVGQLMELLPMASLDLDDAELAALDTASLAG